MKRMVESCEACQVHQRAQQRDPNMPALEYVSRPMQAMGIDFFERYGSKYLLYMGHFSGLPVFARMVLSTDTEHVVRQLKRWFAMFGVAWSIRCDNGPPLFSMAFKTFCKDYCIDLQLTSTYNPENLGAAERGVGLVKNMMKKTKEEGSCFEEALAAF